MRVTSKSPDMTSLQRPRVDLALLTKRSYQERNAAVILTYIKNESVSDRDLSTHIFHFFESLRHKVKWQKIGAEIQQK